MLGLEPEQTLHELATGPGALDADKLRGYLTKHAASGLDLLAAPLRPEDGELVSDETIERLLEVAGPLYDVIVVDTSPSFHGPMLSALERSDVLLFVCTPEVPTLKNVAPGDRDSAASLVPRGADEARAQPVRRRRRVAPAGRRGGAWHASLLRAAKRR